MRVTLRLSRTLYARAEYFRRKMGLRSLSGLVELALARVVAEEAARAGLVYVEAEPERMVAAQLTYPKLPETIHLHAPDGEGGDRRLVDAGRLVPGRPEMFHGGNGRGRSRRRAVR